MRLRIRLAKCSKLILLVILILIILICFKKKESQVQKYKVINFIPHYDYEQPHYDNKVKRNLDPDVLQFGLDIKDVALKFAPKTFSNKKISNENVKLIDSKLSSKRLIESTSKDFIDNLNLIKDEHDIVMLSILDEEYVDFAINFDYFSIKKLEIKNHLFICLDKQSKLYLLLHNISCYFFDSKKFVKSMDKIKSQTSNFGSLSFAYKTNFKTAIMLQALSRGFNVLLVDVDIIFFKNPLFYFNCSNCDVEIQMDRQLYNSGFVFAKSTRGSVSLYETTWNFFIRYQLSHDQSYLNMAIDYLSKANKLPIIRKLPRKLFQIGVNYFENEHRMFENKPYCENCVIAHNNYLGSISAKKYRFRENLLWMVDRDSYYSNENEKYLTYDNRITFNQGTLNEELAALKIAVAISLFLKRILILPRFHCCECSTSNKCSHERFQCSLLSILNVEAFEKTFYKKFRENSFLKHPLIPKSVKISKSPIIYINSTLNSLNKFSSYKKKVFFQPNNFNGATMVEFEEWVAKYKNVSILKFYSFNGVILDTVLERDERFKNYFQITKNLFVCSEYEQWNSKNI